MEIAQSTETRMELPKWYRDIQLRANWLIQSLVRENIKFSYVVLDKQLGIDVIVEDGPGTLKKVLQMIGGEVQTDPGWKSMTWKVSSTENKHIRYRVIGFKA